MLSLVPVALAALSVLAAAAFGLSERSFFGTALEDQFYGFFFRSYPLFPFVAVYGAARILAAAFAGSERRPLRILLAPLALALFLAANFYPNVGGFALRAGYAIGSMSFLQGTPAELAAALGAGAVALAYGLLLGACTMLARGRLRFRRRSVTDALLAVLALWGGAMILLAGQRVGLDLLAGFPQRPLGWGGALPLSGLVALAVLPHALVSWRSDRSGVR